MRRFFSSSQKNNYIHTILKINSVAIKINIKGCVKIEETRKYGCVLIRTGDGGFPFFKYIHRILKIYLLQFTYVITITIKYVMYGQYL